mgnify:CR=1 FL=1
MSVDTIFYNIDFSFCKPFNVGFSHIKIDKSLLDGLGPDTRASLLIAGATYLASGLDMEVIAEGVETEDQAALLRLAGCHKLQGFWFGKPMALEDFRTALIDSDSMNKSAFAFEAVPRNANALA